MKLEKEELERSLLTLKHLDLLKLHHEIFEEKIVLLRHTPPEKWKKIHDQWRDRSAIRFMERVKELGLG